MEEADLGSFSEVINDGTIFVNENNQVVFTVLEKETTFVSVFQTLLAVSSYLKKDPHTHTYRSYCLNVS